MSTQFNISEHSELICQATNYVSLVAKAAPNIQDTSFNAYMHAHIGI